MQRNLRASRRRCLAARAHGYESGDARHWEKPASCPETFRVQVPQRAAPSQSRRNVPNGRKSTQISLTYGTGGDPCHDHPMITCPLAEYAIDLHPEPDCAPKENLSVWWERLVRQTLDDGAAPGATRDAPSAGLATVISLHERAARDKHSDAR